MVLPEQVRGRVLALAADRLGAMPVEEVPPSLRPHARFTPSRRARLAAGPLAAALESDPAFRDRVASGVREGLPELAAAVEAAASRRPRHLKTSVRSPTSCGREAGRRCSTTSPARWSRPTPPPPRRVRLCRSPGCRSS